MRSVTVVVAALATVACGADRTGPRGPSAVQPSPTTITAQVYLDALLEIMQANSINKKTIDWTSFRSEVLTAAGVGQTIPDTIPAIGVALRLLDAEQAITQRAMAG